MDIGLGLDPTLKLSLNEQDKLCETAVELGYQSIWTPEGTGRSEARYPLSNSLGIGRTICTRRLSRNGTWSHRCSSYRPLVPRACLDSCVVRGARNHDDGARWIILRALPGVTCRIT